MKETPPQLPFGLVLKWLDGTRLEEVTAMKVARAAGFPVPRVISYGEHPNTPHAPVSILTTRVSGKEPRVVYHALTDEEYRIIYKEIQCILHTMRKWASPWGGQRICSITGISIRSTRVPLHSIGPCGSETEFTEHLLGTASVRIFESQDAFESKLAIVRKIEGRRQSIVFAHGYSKLRNITVHEGRVSGLIDWEAAGWHPEYREYTTAMRFCQVDSWWFGLVEEMGGGEYVEETECERALIR